jgi:hypothetical protein
VLQEATDYKATALNIKSFVGANDLTMVMRRKATSQSIVRTPEQIFTCTLFIASEVKYVWLIWNERNETWFIT